MAHTSLVVRLIPMQALCCSIVVGAITPNIMAVGVWRQAGSGTGCGRTQSCVASVGTNLVNILEELIVGDVQCINYQHMQELTCTH